MKKLALLALALTAGSVDAQQQFTGLTTGNQIFQFTASTTSAPTGLTAVSGLVGTDRLVGIDYNPNSPGQLVGLGYDTSTGLGRVYSIDSAGAATQINANTINFGSGVTQFGVDFNPQAGALRIVTDRAGNGSTGEQRTTADGFENNFRIAAAGTGAVFYDGDLSVQNGVRAAAYTNNVAGATSTVLYVVDSDSSNGLATLRTIGVPNSGVVSATGPTLGREYDGFDIVTNGGVDTAYVANASRFFTLNLSTGSETLLGNFGALQVLGFSATPVPEPATVGLFAAAGLGLVGFARRSLAAAKQGILAV